ncbi:MAG: OmpA family protein [Planctomycetes bacterium]|nr:OmpA family protein [Planctomycetota bacterium]
MIRSLRIAGAAVILGVLSACVSQEQYRRSLADNDNLRMQRDSQQDYLRRLEARSQDLERQLKELQATVPDAEWVKEQKARIAKILEGYQGNLPPGVSLSSNAEGIVFSVEGEVLFASGQAAITAEGDRTLKQLVATLQNQGKRLRIEGHTDNDPIQRSGWKTNLRLSVERATAVAEFLIAAGMPEDRVAVAGYGEHRPRAGNDSADGKRQNRRVEILVLTNS